MEPQTSPFWSLPTAQVLGRLETGPKGLSTVEAALRLKQYAARRLAPKKRTDALTLLIRQFSSPIVLLLLGATTISLFLHDTTDAAIILAIVLAGGLLGFWQERGAAGAVEKLLSLVEVKAQVLRDGAPHDVPMADVVPGDVVVLSAGAAAPGDCLLLEARDLFADEATLTGETFPAEKLVAVLAAETPLGKRTNAVFMGTHMVSGTATAVVVAIGRDTEFGAVADRLKLRPPETDFERGVRRFGYLLMEVTLLLVRHLRVQRVPASPGARLVPVLDGAGRGPDPPAPPPQLSASTSPRGRAAWPTTRSSSSASPLSRISAA